MKQVNRYSRYIGQTDIYIYIYRFYRFGNRYIGKKKTSDSINKKRPWPYRVMIQLRMQDSKTSVCSIASNLDENRAWKEELSRVLLLLCQLSFSLAACHIEPYITPPILLPAMHGPISLWAMHDECRKMVIGSDFWFEQEGLSALPAPRWPRVSSLEMQKQCQSQRAVHMLWLQSWAGLQVYAQTLGGCWKCTTFSWA